MGLFDKLFGSEKIEKNDSASVQQKTFKTIFDILQIDFQQLPDNSFIKGEESDNTVGGKTTPYRKNLT